MVKHTLASRPKPSHHLRDGTSRGNREMMLWVLSASFLELFPYKRSRFPNLAAYDHKVAHRPNRKRHYTDMNFDGDPDERHFDRRDCSRCRVWRCAIRHVPQKGASRSASEHRRTRHHQDSDGHACDAFGSGLGLLTGSAISSLAEKEAELRNAAVQFIMLDRTLAAYGPETKDARKLLKQLLTERMSLIWPEKGGSVSLAVLGGAKKFLLNQINPGGMFLGRSWQLYTTMRSLPTTISPLKYFATGSRQVSSLILSIAGVR